MNKTITIESCELQVLAPSVAQRYREVSDARLLGMVAQGDDEAGVFLVFYRYGDSLQRLAAAYAEQGCYDELLSELVSDVYAHFATRGWQRLLPQTVSSVGGYLYVVERNMVLQMIRRNKSRRESCLSETGELLTTADMDGLESGLEMEQLMGRMSATRRFVLNKRLVEGYGSKEVAAMLPDFWRSIGEKHNAAPTHAYVDNQVCAARKALERARVIAV